MLLTDIVPLFLCFDLFLYEFFVFNCVYYFYVVLQQNIVHFVQYYFNWWGSSVGISRCGMDWPIRGILGSRGWCSWLVSNPIIRGGLNVVRRHSGACMVAAKHRDVLVKLVVKWSGGGGGGNGDISTSVVALVPLVATTTTRFGNSSSSGGTLW